MCFSAQASFGAAGILSVIGLMSLRKVKKVNLYPFAAIPILFATQQVFEGIVWVTYAQPAQELLNSVAIYGFLFFAFFFWPVWIPFSFIMIETQKIRRNILYGLLGAGLVVSSGLVWSVIMYNVSAEISCSHIKYDIEMPDVFHIWGAFIYCLATIAPFFTSSKRVAWLFGCALATSVIVTAIFYQAYFTSVWCFFSALLSLGIYAYL